MARGRGHSRGVEPNTPVLLGTPPEGFLPAASPSRKAGCSMADNGKLTGFMKIQKAAEFFCGLILFIAVTINMAEIAMRVFFRQSIDLFFDLPVWITVWSMMLITGFLLPEGGHVSIDFLRIKLTGKPRWLLEVILAATTLAYGVFITWSSVLFLRYLYLKRSIFPRSIPIPTWIVELCIPIGMFIFSIFALRSLAQAIRKRW
jgi:TRAP-type C4-dicarboxylate transport system permease small subunit